MNVPRLGNLVKEKMTMVREFAESEVCRFLKSITDCDLREYKKRGRSDDLRNFSMFEKLYKLLF